MEFTILDYSIFVGYLLMMVGFGIWLSRRGKNDTASRCTEYLGTVSAARLIWDSCRRADILLSRAGITAPAVSFSPRGRRPVPDIRTAPH